MITKRKYPWVAKQDWSNILFLSWPVPLRVIRPLVPKPFTIDTFQGTAWISFVIFQAKNSHPRFFPEQLAYCPVTQINVRTYVNFKEGERGVYFLNLHIKSLLAVIGAKALFHLPFSYLKAETDCDDDNSIIVTGKRRTETILSVQYRPTTECIQDGLAHFLTERYCMWHKKKRQIIKIPIIHSLWDLQKVNVYIKRNELLPNFITSEPVAHYNAYKRTKLYPYEVYGYI